MSRRWTLGFTLIELIVVIVVLGIVALMTTSYLGLGAKMYAEAAGRDKLLSQSRFAVERITRELRNVVPNSVRTWNDASRQCVEFAPLLQAGRYEANLVSPIRLFSASSWDQLVATPAVLMAVYPVNAATDIYQRQRVASSLGLTVDSTNNRILNVAFSFSGAVPNSPSQRMYFMTAPVVYCVVGSELRRYQRSSITSSTASADLPGHVLMAEGLDTDFYTSTGASPFSFENSVVLTRNAVVHIRLAFKSDFNDTLVFNQEIHIPNVP